MRCAGESYAWEFLPRVTVLWNPFPRAGRWKAFQIHSEEQEDLLQKGWRTRLRGPVTRERLVVSHELQQVQPQWQSRHSTQKEKTIFLPLNKHREQTARW